jgi:hypothetical protein
MGVEREESGMDESDSMKLLDNLGAILEARGITLDELIASGRDIRGDHLRKVWTRT